MFSEEAVDNGASAATAITRVWRLTGVGADGGAMERAEALAGARVHSAILLVPPQLNAIR